MYSQKLVATLYLIFVIAIFIFSKPVTAASYNPGFTCSDSGKYCSSPHSWRVMDGIKIYKDCWQYSYTKTCDIPSRNNCSSFGHCYEIGIKNCLLRDSYGNCVNQLKEFSCKRRTTDYLDKAKVKYTPTGDEMKRVVCRGIPCIDGNCVDKSYDMNGDMMSSVSQLYASSKLAGARDLRVQLFPGYHSQCSKKPAGYLNCCKTRGWGSDLGASCNVDERKLQEARHRNLCIYVGKTTSGTSPFHVNKHHFCCFGNMLNKVFQIEGRKQLGIRFGNGSNPDCRGLTLEEILRLDFGKMDFSEFIAEIKSKMNIPNVGDIDSRVRGSLPNIKSYDERIRDSDRPAIVRDGGINEGRAGLLADEGDYAK